MINRKWVVLPLLLSLAAYGCIEREGRPVNPCTNVTVAERIEVTNVDKVDLLFMVDNSNSMTEEQVSLTAEFPRMINILASGDFDQDGAFDGPDDFLAVKDLNVGVITSDMGTGGFTVPTCSDSNVGDDGILRRTGRTDLGCSATYPSFLNFQPAMGGSPAAFADDVACVANVGTGGCGFEQQLEAILKAVSPSAATSWTLEGFAPPTFFRGTFGHADDSGPNGGFIRDNSVLAIIPVTDEEDCSASDPELFNPTSATYGSTDLNLRCFAHPTALHPISRFVDGLIQLRRNPAHLIYAPIVGIPTDLAPAAGETPDWDALVSDDPALRDDRMEEMVDPATGNRLLPSCDVPGVGVAFPPVRITRVAQRLDDLGAGVTVQSICQSDFSGALQEVIRQIKSALGAACLPRQLGVEADGRVACDVLAVMPDGRECDTGSSPLIENGVEVVEDGKTVCVVEQLIPSNDDRAAETQPTGTGWYYDNYTTEGEDNCANGASVFQRIAFTDNPTSGAEIRLECFQTVQGGGETEVVIGALCDPDPEVGQIELLTPTEDGSTTCAEGTVGGAALSCDPAERACGLGCVVDADCRSAGLVGFVCDDRPLGEVEPDQFPGSTDAYNFCVNPTCS